MKTVKFKKAGRWADPNPAVAQISVEAGEKVEVSNELADFVEDNDAGEVIKTVNPLALVKKAITAAKKAIKAAKSDEEKGAADKNLVDAEQALAELESE